LPKRRDLSSRNLPKGLPDLSTVARRQVLQDRATGSLLGLKKLPPAPTAFLSSTCPAAMLILAYKVLTTNLDHSKERRK